MRESAGGAVSQLTDFVGWRQEANRLDVGQASEETEGAEKESMYPAFFNAAMYKETQQSRIVGTSAKRLSVLLSTL